MSSGLSNPVMATLRLLVLATFSKSAQVFHGESWVMKKPEGCCVNMATGRNSLVLILLLPVPNKTKVSAVMT